MTAEERELLLEARDLAAGISDKLSLLRIAQMAGDEESARRLREEAGELYRKLEPLKEKLMGVKL